MRESTERALRWFLRKKLVEEKFAIKSRLESRSTKAAHEEEIWEFERIKGLLDSMDDEEGLDKN